MASTTDESYEWVELLDPKSQRTMYVNLDSGECCWDPPKNQTVKPLSSDQWWELFDVKAQRNYYYNSITRETVWQRPSNGDIIPLANLQLLQQNMQQVSNTANQDIGMLRRSSSKVSSTTGNRRVHSRKVPTSILEDSTRPGSDLDQSNRTDSHDCFSREEPAPRRPSVDPISLASEQLHRLSTQNVGAAYRPYGNQRVRDWLREAGVAWEHSGASVAHTPTPTAVEGTERKNSGCFSDRPARRIHSFTSQNAAPARQPTDQSSECLLTPNTENPTLDLVEPAKIPLRNSSDLGATRPGSTQPDLVGAWIPEQLRHSSEASRAQRDLRSISGPSASHIDARKSLTPSSLSDKVDSARLKGNAGDDFANSVPSNSTVMEKEDLHRRNTPHSKPLNGKPQRPTLLQSERTAYPVVTGMNLDTNPAVTRHRAFPRTNPTVSRPAAGGTASRPVRFSATTLDRPINANYTSMSSGSNTNDQRTSMGAATSVHRNPAFNVIHFSNTDLRTNAPEVVNGSDSASRSMDHANDQQEHLQCHSSRENPSSFDIPLALSNQAPTMPPYYQLGVKAPLLGSSNNKNNSNSPNSSSPQPSSSSSSSSFSRASSGTALTNTDSEENKQIVHSAPNQSLDSAVQALPTPRRASLNHENKSLQLNTFQPQFSLAPASEQSDGNIDLDQPPIPPPRSASTLGPNRLLQHCTSDFYRLAQGGMFLRSDPYVLTQRPYALCYPRYPNYMIHQPVPHLDGGPINDSCTVSSLSRKDPARMNVILPNHRRPPPFVYQARPPCPMSGNTTVYYVHPFDVLVHDTAPNCTNNSFVGQSAVNHRLSSTSSPLLPSTGVELCSIGSNGNGPTGATSPSTATTWVSHSTATWDLDKLRTEHGLCIPTSESEQQMQSLVSPKPQTGDPMSSVSATSTGQTATTSAVLQRSPSGGFIGPEELNDSVWFSTSDRERSTGPPVPLFTLVQPGHPQFPSFIAPFEWSRTLFKPDQDVATLMSWTKSTFSKRLLVSTEPNMKKQVADIFKIVQSFMGDRKARLSLPDYGSIIVHRALNTVGLRDEIFAQLCKQTTANPDIKSLTNGWALICVCLYYFPPNSKFRDALLAYLNARAEAAVSLVFQSAHSLNKVPSSLEAAAAIASGLAPIVSELNCTSNVNGQSYSQIMPTAATTTISTNATTTTRGSTIGSVKSEALISESSDLVDTECGVSASGRRTNSLQLNTARQFEFAVGLWDRPTAAHFARVAPRWFVRALNVGPRKLLEAPSIEEICHVKDFILKPSIFGGTLTEMMRIQAYRFPHLRLPWIQIFLTEELLRLNGPVTEGVFRLSPDLDLVTEIRCQLEKLFEIFRVVHVCVLDPECNQTDDLQHPPECFRILRPPPVGWSLSSREFETETAPLPDEENRGAVQMKSAPILDQSIQLTGAFTWPLAPVQINSPPSEYVLLTPTNQWPRSLSDMAARISNNSAGEVQIDPHLAAGLLKLWLREMADPLIPIELQPECLKAACEAEVFESQLLMNKDSSLSETVSNPNPIQVCCSLVRKIPPLERRSLLYLILLLQHLAKRENASRSLMDPRNLATVIAPNLMRSSSTNPRDLLENIRPQTLFVRLLISYLDVDAELQQLLTTVRAEDDVMCIGADLDGVWSRTPDPGSNTWAAPVRVRLGSDNGLLPA